MPRNLETPHEHLHGVWVSIESPVPAEQPLPVTDSTHPPGRDRNLTGVLFCIAIAVALGTLALYIMVMALSPHPHLEPASPVRNKKRVKIGFQDVVNR